MSLLQHIVSALLLMTAAFVALVLFYGGADPPKCLTAGSNDDSGPICSTWHVTKSTECKNIVVEPYGKICIGSNQ